MLERLTRVQLAIFAVVTAITVAIMAIFYLRLPAAMGIGTYRVTANFVAGGGLYKNATSLIAGSRSAGSIRWASVPTVWTQ
jgi:phospholipid/cholesterol/gamma-HCH transport system substrate-binding protein